MSREWRGGDVVVIDMDNDRDVERLDAAYQKALDASPRFHSLADIMRTALREFAKPDEPTGLGAVVRDAEDRLFVKNASGWWRGADDACSRNWADVAAVEVLSEGYNQGADEPLADWERDLLRGAR